MTTDLSDAAAAVEEPMLAKTPVKNAILKFLVAGTAGAYLAFISRSVPLDLPSYVGLNEANCNYTLSIIIRYGYLLWFLAYFFTSNLRIEIAPDPKVSDAFDIAFDVLQCVAGFTAAYFLGFLIPNKFTYPDDIITGVLWADRAIAFISALSLALFSWKKDRRGNDKLNLVRLGGLGIAATSALLVHCLGTTATPGRLALALGFLVLLFLLLFMFGKESAKLQENGKWVCRR